MGLPLLPIPTGRSIFIFSQQMYLLNILLHAAQSRRLSPQNAVYFMKLSLRVHIIFTFYINNALEIKCPNSSLNVNKY
jgi:hypothetical protein